MIAESIIAEFTSTGIVRRPNSVAEQILIADTEIAGEGEWAIDIEYPPVASWVLQTVTIRNVTIRGKWSKGLIRLRHCWNARLTDVMAMGETTHETIGRPVMPVGFDLGGSMDVHINGCTVTCAQDGVRSEDGEGLHVLGGFYMHCLRSFHLIGDPTRRGRWGSPVARIEPSHTVYIEHGVLAVDYGGLTIGGDIYQSPHAQFGWGAYLVRCEDAKIGARFWYNQPTRRGGAIVLDACKGTLVSGNRVSDSMQIGLIEFDNCTGTVIGDNVWNGTQSYPALT